MTDSWLKQVILHGGRQRDYLHTRMPIYKQQEVEDCHLFLPGKTFSRATGYPVSNIKTSKNANHGMMGTSWLSCIRVTTLMARCFLPVEPEHWISFIPLSPIDPKNWFHLYMPKSSSSFILVDHAQLSRVEPAILKSDSEGSTDQQIEALWNYLSDGERAKYLSGPINCQSLTTSRRNMKPCHRP